MIPEIPSESLSASRPIVMGDRVTFEQVFRNYHKSLSYYAQRMVIDQTAAEDLVSEVFMKCWKERASFDNDDHARFYLYRAVRHAAINYLKAAQRTAKKHADAGNVYADTEESHQERYIRSEVLRSIYQQIEILPTQERAVLLLSLREGKKLQEIADELGLSLQTVKNCKGRALRRLRTKLSAEDFIALLVVLSYPFS
ncbi:RNA polymerase sigma factor [Parapedobacter soli]|uniref:RNA polymerase sigma factor n=1 Tax=Parapedobacter soli TaxID=416955 RepID=UPI0021C73119|nr:RNA polymerase sigma-70 factor [Parapedobacter soli]